ncbi:hypothetical protein Tco_0583243 [Tanacetum coccineum]
MTASDGEVKWSEEHERLPLKQRLKMLRAKALSDNKMSPVDNAVVMMEDGLRHSMDLQYDVDVSEERSDSASCEQIQQLNYQKHSSVDQIEIPEDFFEEFDHVVLRERLRMLLSRSSSKLVGSTRSTLKDHSSGLSTSSVDMISRDTRKSSERNDTCGIRSGSLNCSTAGAPTLTYQHQGPKLTESQRRLSGSKAINEVRVSSGSCKTLRTSALPPFPSVKVEPLDEELEILKKDAFNNPYLGNHKSVKSELESNSEDLEDIIDHMILGDRIRLLASRKVPKNVVYENFEASNDHKQPILSESSKPLLMKQPRKRRKTVTNSIETALEEDAPGLLQVLVEQGVLVDEIKLYGEPELYEGLDESLVEESFSELEEVITKVGMRANPDLEIFVSLYDETDFPEKHSSIKFTSSKEMQRRKHQFIACACQFHYGKQARYLHLRKWPVEWGWCRDLQSFIFVFEKHNRIVLERPEYGYATYFFELVDALPVKWQIKRLVTTMKLTSCSRITLIENRALTVGDDLTEGEARVLMEYGWIPDTGLADIMLGAKEIVYTVTQ